MDSATTERLAQCESLIATISEIIDDQISLEDYQIAELGYLRFDINMGRADAYIRIKRALQSSRGDLKTNLAICV